MDKNIGKLLLSELHMVVYQPGKAENLTDASLTEAVTINENLQSYGYTLKPQDILALAAGEDLAGFYQAFTELVPEVKADPMYPDFPSQVMEMSEAQFRLHQAIHYFSTYGIEFMTGSSVKKGWLPEVKKTKKTETDTVLLEAKVLDLIPEEEAYVTALSRILKKRERPSLPEKEIILHSVKMVTPEQLKTVRVPFKENLLFVFSLMLEQAQRDICIQTLSCLCMHTGDVLKCVHSYLKDAKYHLRTSQKKTIVRLLECYPEKDFRENLMRSDQEREKNLVILRHLDFNQYCIKESHREAVRALRNGELRSWEGQAEAYLKQGDPCALSFIGKRPGLLLRKLNRLIEMGYSEEELTDAICIHARKLSPHTMVQTIRAFSEDELEIERKYRKALETIKDDLVYEWKNATYMCYQRYREKEYRYSTYYLEYEKRMQFDQAKRELGILEMQKRIRQTEREVSEIKRELALAECIKEMESLHDSNEGHEIDWTSVKTWILSRDPVVFKEFQNQTANQSEELEKESKVLLSDLSDLSLKLKEREQEIAAEFARKLLE